MADASEPPPAQAPPIAPVDVAAPSGSSSSNRPPRPPSRLSGHDLPSASVRLILSPIRTTDTTALRLNKLLSSPRGVSTALFTAQYTLWLVGHIAQQITPATKSVDTSSLLRLSSSFSALASNLSTARTTLRLTGLIPLYAWLRSLLRDGPSPSTDKLTHYINLLQCVSYLIFQSLENIAHLHDISVLKLRSGSSAKLWLYSCRAWLLGVSCDFARLARERQLAQRERIATAFQRAKHSSLSPKEIKDAEIKEREFRDQEEKWWGELWSTVCWFPICLHYSLPGGLKGMNQGSIGGLGLMAEGRTFWGAWRGAK